MTTPLALLHGFGSYRFWLDLFLITVPVECHDEDCDAEL
jgi:hypothetical protein